MCGRDGGELGVGCLMFDACGVHTFGWWVLKERRAREAIEANPFDVEAWTALCNEAQVMQLSLLNEEAYFILFCCIKAHLGVMRFVELCNVGSISLLKPAARSRCIPIAVIVVPLYKLSETRPYLHSELQKLGFRKSWCTETSFSALQL